MGGGHPALTMICRGPGPTGISCAVNSHHTQENQDHHAQNEGGSGPANFQPCVFGGDPATSGGHERK